MIVEKHFVASGKHTMAAVSRRLARADGVSIVLQYAKRYDTCSEARTAATTQGPLDLTLFHSEAS